MKTLLTLLVTLLLPLGSLRAAPLNIVLIISDDHAHTDYGFMGHKSVRTPNLDRLARESLLYTRGYATPVCSPSLATLLTGRLPHQHGITGNDLAAPTAAAKRDRSPLTARLLANPFILPKALSDAGYLTFQTGKLWNTTFGEVGFTHGMTDKMGRHGGAGLEIGRKGMKPIFDFIAEARKQQKPFFVWYAPLLPHDPHTPPAELLAKYAGKGPAPAAEKYFAMVEWLDQTCGELDAHLAAQGLKENTVLIYLADNGWDGARGHQSNRAKLSPYETGIRTPIFLRWPGRVKPRRDDKTLASIIDVVPTIAKAAGLEAPADLPGLDLADRAALQKRPAITVESYTHDIADLAAPEKSLLARVVISGWTKLLLPGPARPDRPFSSRPEQPELFDLKADAAEQTNLATRKPKEVARLRALQDAIWKLP
jgi:uncharacterized sulfatase